MWRLIDQSSPSFSTVGRSSGKLRFVPTTGCSTTNRRLRQRAPTPNILVPPYPGPAYLPPPISSHHHFHSPCTISLGALSWITVPQYTKARTQPPRLGETHRHTPPKPANLVWSPWVENPQRHRSAASTPRDPPPMEVLDKARRLKTFTAMMLHLSRLPSIQRPNPLSRSVLRKRMPHRPKLPLNQHHKTNHRDLRNNKRKTSKRSQSKPVRNIDYKLKLRVWNELEKRTQFYDLMFTYGNFIASFLLYPY